MSSTPSVAPTLVELAGVHVEPFGAYSSKIKSARRAARGRPGGHPQRRHQRRPRPAAAAEGRRDHAQGPEPASPPRAKDIAENPKSIKVRELEAATLPRVLNQVDLALINTNYALEASLNPTKDALVIEGSRLALRQHPGGRADNKDNAALQKLAKALNSAEVKSLHRGEVQGRGGAGVLIDQPLRQTKKARSMSVMLFTFGNAVAGRRCVQAD